VPRYVPCVSVAAKSNADPGEGIGIDTTASFVGLRCATKVPNVFAVLAASGVDDGRHHEPGPVFGVSGDGHGWGA
jgi:hypothetical protein